MFSFRLISKPFVINDIIKINWVNIKFLSWQQQQIRKYSNLRLCRQYINSIRSSSRFDSLPIQYSSVMCAKQSINKKGKFKFTDYDCIGFDLDNTLARYKVGAMIEMEYDIIAKFLVNEKGYSKEYLLKPIDQNFILKGLIVDDEHGNLLRISDNGTILQAAHGTKFLSEEQILKYYPENHWHITDLFAQDPVKTWNGPYAEKMRTLLDYYDIIVSLIFARTIDWIDDKENGEQKVYTVWPDILEALQDMFERTHFRENKGGYFAEMKNNPEKYYFKCSEKLIKWLTELKSQGKILYLLTGSHVDFASHTALHTLGPNWRDYFDIVICFAKKPGFFTMSRDFIGVDGVDETVPVEINKLALRNIYTHGNWSDLRNFLKKHIRKDNPKFLYVGDNLVQDVYTPHVYADCDTVAVCEELEAERKYGYDNWHPDEQFLVSNLWGSYFHGENANIETNWSHIIKKHSKLCVPNMEFVAGFSIDHEFEQVL